MLSYVSSDFFVMLTTIFMFVIVLWVISNRAKERRERIRILEEQLRTGRLDGAAQQRAMDELTRRPAHTPPSAPSAAARPFSSGSRFVFAIGWIGLFLGIGLLLHGGRGETEAGLIVGSLGFAFITLPIAIRELESDRRSRSA